MFGLPSTFYVSVGLWAVVLHGVWEYAQVITLYCCWERWTRWERIWILPAATLGDAVAMVVLTAVAAAALGTAHVHPLSGTGTVLLLALGLVAGIALVTWARRLDLWRYATTMPTVRVGEHPMGLVPGLQMAILRGLAVGKL